MDKEKQNKFCCEAMEASANNYDNATPLIEYRGYTRSYDFLRFKHPNGTHQKLWYCPWCGTRLPNELGEDWERLLKEEYGVDDPFDKDKEKVPSEFWTDEWWKKRGLK